MYLWRDHQEGDEGMSPGVGKVMFKPLFLFLTLGIIVSFSLL